MAGVSCEAAGCLIRGDKGGASMPLVQPEHPSPFLILFAKRPSGRDDRLLDDFIFTTLLTNHSVYSTI